MIPHPRAQGGGRIIQLSSMGGQIALPANGSLPRHQMGHRGLLGILRG
ncbi:hypothetical protein [Nonomuraea endophytica]